jgi:two-component system LytT family response regulator
MIKTILVDDEPIALKHLATIIEKHCPQLEVIATASTVTDALEKIGRLSPELVFLDIQLAGEKSFDILHQAKQRTFELIFVTAYDQFGIQAVKHEAMDYILKPINKTELMEAIEKAGKKIYQKRVAGHGAQPVMENIKNTIGRLALPTMEGLLFVDTASIMYCESEGRYTRFYLAEENKEILVSKNLGEYEAQLPSGMFIRIHHQSIVNIHYIHKYIKGRGGYVVLKNGKNIPVSSRKKDDFFDKLA